MERNVKIQRKSLSLGKRINMRQSANFGTDDENHVPDINERDSPLKIIDAQATPPHGKHCLDESIEYSPMDLNSSFSPSIMYTQAAVLTNSDVGWQWENEANKCATNAKSKASEAKDLKHASYKKREHKLKEMEYKIRQAENNKAAELLRQRCAKFEKQLQKSNDETKNKVANIQPKKLFDEKSHSTTKETVDKKEPIKPDEPTGFDDFFNDSAMDDYLLVATQQVEENIKLSQAENETPRKSTEKRSSIYIKFLEDDEPDDLFGSLDDIIAQAMETTKPKSSFQRYNSMPIKSMSPKSHTTSANSKILNNISRSSANSTETRPPMKRHASTHDVQIYHPPKMKQIRRI